MPLIVMCGIPSSGKTTRAKEIEAFLKNEQRSVQIVSEETLLIDKQKAYTAALSEKNTRAALKASVERYLTQGVTVISDSLNYIKGYRYELFCLARAANTTMCVVFCDTHQEICSDWNLQRPDRESWSENMFTELSMRFEHPNPRNKWDSQLIVVQNPELPFPFEELKGMLYQKANMKANQATQAQVLTDTNFVHQLEKITQKDIMTTILANPTALPGDTIKVPQSTILVTLHRIPNLAELRRLRQQFFKLAQMHPPPVASIGTSFVEFLNTNNYS